MPRVTKQREAIEAAFSSAKRPLSPTELHAMALRSVPGLGVATVYRTLRRLEEDGIITPIAVPGEPPRYELTHIANHHHHHFHCRVCGRVYDIHGCPTGLGKMAPNGFLVENHTVVLHGICKACA